MSGDHAMAAEDHQSLGEIDLDNLDDSGDEPDVEEDATDGENSQSSKKFGRGRAKGKGKAKAKAKGKAKGKAKANGRPGKNRNGTRFCQGCQKFCPVDQFQNGSAQCADDRRAMQNIAYAARHQNQTMWWEEVQSDPCKLFRVLKTYHKKHPKPVDGKKRSALKMLQFIDYVKQEELIIRDRVKVLMDQKQYRIWAAEPINGGIDYETASRKFQDMYDAPGAITDEEGSTDKFRSRVAVLVQERIIERDQEVRGRGYDLTENQIKKATQQDIDAAEARVQRGSVVRGAAAQSRDQLAQDMIKAGSGASFSALAKGIANTGKVIDLDSSDGDDQEGAADADMSDGDASVVGKPASVVGKPTSSAVKRKGSELLGGSDDGTPVKKSQRRRGEAEAWMDDGKIMTALDTFDQWYRTTETNLKAALSTVQTARDKAGKVAEDVAVNERRLAQNRYVALRLVLADIWGLAKELHGYP